MSLYGNRNVSNFGTRKVNLSAEEEASGNVGKALTLSTKRGSELAWRFNKDNLSWLKRRELFQEIYGLCRESFCVKDSSEFRNDVKHHIFDTHEICIVPFGNVPDGLSPTCFKTDKIAAFASYNFLHYWTNREFIYFSGIVVDTSLQGLNYGSLLMQEIMKSNGIKLAVLRTQSPVMYNSFAKVCKVFPSFDGREIPGEIKNIGKYVARNILRMSDYDEGKMIGKETYGKSLYGKEPILNNSELNRIFKQKINASRGDSIIVVGELK
ncbi:MAG: GNAT family N-acetyltransferase [Candidatus Pacebacteria bacterium]|nr:GNAT family N-acetyltransferase [Candidatus Paceibacterota bacterium]